MRNRRWPVAIFFGTTLATFLIIFGCAKQEAGQVLAFKFKPGEVTKYRTTMDMKTGMMGQMMAMKMDLEQSNTVQEVLPSGSARVEQRLDKVSMTSESPMGAMLATVAKQLEGKAFQIVTSPAGKVESVSGLSGLGEMPQGGMDMDQMASNFYAPFPEKPIKPGDSWNQEKTIPVSSGGANLSNHLIMKYLLVGYEPIGGVQCAKIKTSGTFEITGNAGPQGTMNGKGAVEGFSYFDPSAGRMIEVTAKSNSTMTMAPSKGMQMTVTMEQDIKVELLK